jgi:hypothetical protein
MPLWKRLHLAVDGRPKFTEFRAPGISSEQWRASGVPGDIFIDTEEYQIWYFEDQWVRWKKIKDQYKHPNYPDRILVPLDTCFGWSHSSLILDATLRAKAWLGPKVRVEDIAKRFLEEEAKATAQFVKHGNPNVM